MQAKLIAPLRVPPHQPPYAAQTVVEFALVSLVLFMLVFGIIEFGRAVTTRAMVTNAVREAMRVGVITPNNMPAIFNAAQNRSPMLGLVSGNLTVTCTTWTSTTSVSCDPTAADFPIAGRIQVCISHNFTFIVAGLLGVSGSIPMSECAIGVIQ